MKCLLSRYFVIDANSKIKSSIQTKPLPFFPKKKQF